MRSLKITVLTFIIQLLTLKSIAAPMNFHDYLALPAAPIDATVKVDSTQTATQIIAAKTGGQLQLVAQDQTVYTLKIEPDSLENDTEFTISLIQDLQHPSLAFDSGVSGVQILPSGTVFHKPASLTIKRVTAISDDNLVPMSFSDNGKDLHLTFATQKDNETTLKLTHLSSYAIGSSPTLRETILQAVTRLSEFRLSSYLAYMLKNHPADADTLIKAALDEYFEKIVKPLASNVQSCSGGRTALNSYFQVLRQIQIYGYDYDPAPQNFIPVLKHRTFALCNEEARKACFEEHRPRTFLDYYLSILRSGELTGADPDSERLLNDLKAMADRCLKFKMTIKTDVSPKAPPKGLYISGQVNYDLSYNLSEDVVKGFMNVDSASVRMEFGANLVCSTQVLTNDPGPFDLLKMRFYSTGDTSKNEAHTSLETIFATGPQNLTWDTTCHSKKHPENSYTTHLTNDLTGILIVNHRDIEKEVDAQSGLWIVKSWNVFDQGPIVASKEYNRGSSQWPDLNEHTVLELKHTPDAQ
ncbi:MAG: hypothetical protein ACXWR0_08095 [Bdellovibrio sp.]